MTDSPLPREAVLIVNARSRKGEESFSQSLAKLREAGFQIIGAHPVKDPRHLVPTVERAIEDGAPMIILGGGDGTITSSIGSLVGRDCLLAILPLGTANSFARSLELPLDLDEAVAAIATGQRRRIDVGRINGRHFANAAALGLSPMIGETVPHKLKRYLGRFGYLLWALWCLARFRPFRLVVDQGDRRERMWATEVRIFNGQFQSGVEFLESEIIDQGVVVVQAVTGKSLARLSWNWFARFFRLPGEDVDVRNFTGRRLSIEARPQQKISLDGEVLTRTPATIECLPEAVEIVVARDAAEA